MRPIPEIGLIGKRARRRPVHAASAALVGVLIGSPSTAIDRIRAGLPILLAIAFLSTPLGAADLPPLSHRFTVLEDPSPAPPLRLEDIDGVEHDLADLEGRLVLVNFWATWCPPCRREMPSLERLYRQLNARGLTVLAVDVGEDLDTVFAFTGQLDPAPSFPLLLDTDASAAQDWKVKGLPTSFVVDPGGRVIIRAVGGTEFDDAAAVEQLLPYLPKP